jgi:hypothetical protein
MLQKVKWLLGAAYALLVVAALSFGATQALAVTAQECGDDPWEVGTCPPLDEESCPEECDKVFGTTGKCVAGCCICVL